MIRYLVEHTSRKRAVKPVTFFMQSFFCCLIVMLNGLIVTDKSHALTCPTLSKGDEVIVQNVGKRHEERSGLNVRNQPNTNRGNDPITTVYDGTKGIILSSEPTEGPKYIWYQVRWNTSPKIEGWSVGIYGGTKVIETTLAARQKDKLVEALFGLNPGEANIKTRHDYNDYACSWEGDPYTGGHGGWDAVVDSPEVPFFYALIGGELIQAGGDDYNTIAIYNRDYDMTILYLHANEVAVSTQNPTITEDDLLGTQGSTGPNVTGAHVHIEVRKGRRGNASAGADASQETNWPNMDPVPTLYKARFPPTGGGTEPSTPDVNNDNRVDILDLILVWINIDKDIRDSPQFDVNHDGVIDKKDVVEVAENLDDPPGAGAAPAVSSHNQIEGITIRAGQVYIGDTVISREMVQQLLNLTRAADDGSLDFKRSITILQSILAAVTSNQTTLFANYPNPFNPETWIPYQLAKDAEVTLRIYDIKGQMVRMLVLGHQAAGIYQNRSRAAYWDGRNAVGEPVASGVYFYTLTAGEFTATRKMLIRK